ncbi:hypothetical protein AGMMS49592_4730 [Endomicrobiia bacterium]|nr:hypothetical protein AGMMS49592_4730 [Endomicrobiia bacterium]
MAGYSLRVLLVDCVVEDAKLFESIATNEHHDIDKASTAHEALNCMKEKWYHLLFYSVNPKDIDTINFIKTVKQLDNQSKLWIILVYPQIKAIESEVKDASVWGIISKPYSVDDIKRWLNRAVGFIDLHRSINRLITAFTKEFLLQYDKRDE